MKTTNIACCSLLLSITLLLSCSHADQKPAVISPTIPVPSRADAIPQIVAVDQSPMDMSFFPVDFPLLKMNGADSGQLLARVIYSRPQKKGRQIFGSEEALVHYGKEWRLGANEATEIEFYQPVRIQGKAITKGRYILYCYPYPTKWTLVLNNNLNTWGLHMDAKKDLYRFDVPVYKQDPPMEYFTMKFDSTATGANLLMTWDTVRCFLPIEKAR